MATSTRYSILEWHPTYSRGHSSARRLEGLPRKNVLPLAGKPLIVWTLEAALASKYLDRVVLSSDNDESIHVAREAGCDVPFVRPVHLAADDIPGIKSILHDLDALD